MASSFMRFKDNGFWMKDGFIESYQLLLFEEINKKYNDQIDWLNEYKKNIALDSLPLMVGAMSMYLDETLIDQNCAEMIVSLIEEIKLKISTDKNYLTGIHLNSLRKKVREYLVKIKELDWAEEEIEKNATAGGWYENELPVKNYLVAFDLLYKLLTGQLSFKSEDPVTYWDF